MKKFSDINNLSITKDDLSYIKKLISFSLIGESKGHPVSIDIDDEAIKKIEELIKQKQINLLTELKSILQATKNINAIDAIIENLKNSKSND